MSQLTDSHPAATTRQGSSAGPASPSSNARPTLRPLALDAARITGGFWHNRLERNGTVAIREGYDRLVDAGNLANLRIAAGTEKGEARGPVFMDSDVYKWLEAVAWEYHRQPDAELLTLQREVTAIVAAAQAADGYLDSVVQIEQGGKRYAKLPWSHEHYCAGHLIQAAVAQVRATGDTALMDVAVKLADHLVATFGEGKTIDVDGHPVIEMALVELFRETGRREYLTLANFFVHARGHGILESHSHEPTYFSDRTPVREATSLEGHAVRAVYLAAGAADLALEEHDDDLLAALDRQFDHVWATKTYITGGLGARWEGEAFGDPYELPADRAYAETCAAIGGIQWAWRMLLATGRAKYADAIERMLYNGFLAGVSLGGNEYFYVNPLQLREHAAPDENRSPAHGRRQWFSCACCPPNIMRTFSSLAGYLATSTDDGLQIHQYATGELTGPGGRVSVETAYPWDGTVQITVLEAPTAGTPDKSEWALDLRIPGWAEGATVSVNGEGATAASPGSYASVQRRWKVGDAVVLELPLEPHFTAPDSRVDAVRGCLALERGPLVYAFEHVDQDGGKLESLRLDAGAGLTIEQRDDLLGGVATVVAGADDAGTSVPLTGIPYYAWAGREIGAMRVWVPTV